jgi:hypothetical protein
MLHAYDILVMALVSLVMLAWLCFPWLSVPRRFSLRTMLAATTLVAVFLGLVAWATG